MNSTIGKGLTPRQERLIAKYFDGECWFAEKVVVSRLVKSSEEARKYLDDLKNVRDICVNPESFHKVELWEGIAQRIEQEEKCAILLGRRAVDVRGSTLRAAAREMTEWLSGRSVWQVSGALTAACCVFLVFGISGAPTPEGNPTFERIASARD